MDTFSVRALVAVLLVVGITAGCGKGGPQGHERPPAVVSVAVASKQDVPVYIDNVGKTVAREVVSIQPQVSGRITKIHFTDGADLNKGDLLFTIDPRPYEAQLANSEGVLAEKKAQVELAKIQFNRYKELLESKSVSQQDYDQRKNTLDIAQAQVEQSEAAVETARINLDYCAIKSPIDGRAGQRLVDVGNVVAANSGSLLVIERLDPIYVDFTIPENDLTAVQRNMRNEQLKVEARLPDDPDNSRTGALTFLDNAIQEGTGTVKLRATIPNEDHYFWPGRFVKVRLILKTIEGATLMPAAATQMSAKGPFVYVVKEDSSAELRPTRLGQRQGDMVVVDGGVEPGERVVVTGQLAIIPGSKVHVEETGSAKSPPNGKEGQS